MSQRTTETVNALYASLDRGLAKWVASAALVFTVLGCAQVEQMATFVDGLMRLGEEIATAYPGENIAVESTAYFEANITRDVLTVYFINSSYDNLPANEQETRAREIAGFVKDQYASIDQIEVIEIVFRQHSEVIVVSTALT